MAGMDRATALHRRAERSLSAQFQWYCRYYMGAACRRRTRGRSSGGRLFGATSTKSNDTASLVIPPVSTAPAPSFAALGL